MDEQAPRGSRNARAPMGRRRPLGKESFSSIVLIAQYEHTTGALPHNPGRSKPALDVETDVALRGDRGFGVLDTSCVAYRSNAASAKAGLGHSRGSALAFAAAHAWSMTTCFSSIRSSVSATKAAYARRAGLTLGVRRGRCCWGRRSSWPPGVSQPACRNPPAWAGRSRLPPPSWEAGSYPGKL